MGIRRVKKIDNLVEIRNIFWSVAEKNGLPELARALFEVCPKLENIYSSGGTATALVDALGEELSGRVITSEDYTGMKETEGGLVKTLHHKFFLGYLTETYSKGHQRDLEREGAVPIDLFIGHFYPFANAVVGKDADIETARGHIDIGGPGGMVAAAKNWLRIAVAYIAGPEDNAPLIAHLKANKGMTTAEFRYNQHIKALEIIKNYRTQIYDFVSKIPFEEAMKAYPEIVGLKGPKGGE